ncbi:scavenger receptor cysteine-rich type 1 protein M160 isoform X2 [Chanodichthys erythropterus]
MFRLRDGDNVCSGLVEMYNITDNSWVPLQKKVNSQLNYGTTGNPLQQQNCTQLNCTIGNLTQQQDVPPEVICTQLNCTIGNLTQQQDVPPEVICTQLNCGATGNFKDDHGTNNLRLTCSDNVKLRNLKPKCFGDVIYVVNGFEHGVCFSNMKKARDLGKVVCRELGCGEVLDVKQNLRESNALLHDVECKGDEVSLWHCPANHEKKQCRTTTVTCAGSLDVRLSDGLGRCSGRVELQLEGSWLSISSKDWTEAESNVVCGHLKCGNSTKKIKQYFIEGNQKQLESPWSFKCKDSTAKLHECLKINQSPSPLPSRSEANIQIICQKEELMFFEGDSPCKGRIRIDFFNDEAEDRWLPAEPKKENKKKATDTCHAMGCGNLTYFEKEDNSTYANVTCSGQNSVELRNKRGERCWGTVAVCRGGNCDSICKDTWENQESKKICENLGCGNPIDGQFSFPRNRSAFYSVYCLEERQNMSMCKFISKNDCSGPAQVICTGSIKARLEDPRDKCAGNVSLLFGDWTPVCKDSLNEALKNTICRELNCGEAISETSPHESKIKGLLGTITCQSNANSVSKCKFNSISVKEKPCPVGYLKCTEWKRLFLYKKEGPCRGPVYALSEGKTQHVNGQGWGQEEGQQLCKYLQCGNYTDHTTRFLRTVEWWNKTYNCSGKTDMWECERNNQAVQPTQQLNITCNGNPNITLSNKCAGKVLIDNESVCASHFKDHMFSDLCDSLNCGKAIHHWSTTFSVKTNCYHFSCTGNEMLLWQCGYKKSECEKFLSVVCEDSIELGSTEKYGGKLVVKYSDQWNYVCGTLNPTDTKMVCEKLNCTDVEKLDESKNILAKEIEVTINCPKNHQRISQCVHFKEEKKKKCIPAEIKCEGCVEEDKPQTDFGLIAGLSLGVLGLLIMVFLWMSRKRLLLVLRRYRNKNGKDINVDGNEMNNIKKEDRDLSEGKASLLDYDDYEDVDSDKNKTRDEDADNRSQGSSGTEYDDIEGQNGDISPHQMHNDDNLPLLPKRPDNILEDQDTYEVETENQEEYDDVMPVEAAADENAGTADTQAQMDVAVDAGTDSEAGTGVNADAVVVTAEVEVHAEQE